MSDVYLSFKKVHKKKPWEKELRENLSRPLKHTNLSSTSPKSLNKLHCK